MRRFGLRDGRWKVIVDADAGGTEVYDLATDPGSSAPCAANERRRRRQALPGVPGPVTERLDHPGSSTEG